MIQPERNVIDSVGGFFFQIIREIKKIICFFGETLYAAGQALRHPGTIRRKEFLYHLTECGPDAVAISLLICLLMGLIAAYQSAVQMHKYGADAFLPALVGCSIVRELGPLMVAIIATGRVGSAFAAEIATMKSTEEINALLTFGFSPWRFLVVPKLFAMILTMPVLTLVGNAAGILGGLLVGVVELSIPAETYISSTIHWVPFRFFVESLVKSVVFSILITLISCYHGFEAKEDALGIGRATTTSVVVSIVAIILADSVLAKLFNFIFYGL